MKLPARSLAHFSDLHLGRSRKEAAAAADLVRTVIEDGIDHVVLTGDITHRGLRNELRLFELIFEPLLRNDRVTVIPGNHDRLGDDVSLSMMSSGPVSVARVPGLYLVRIDSTGPHNKSLVHSHGELSLETIDAVSDALDQAPDNVCVALALHHHLLPLPEETVGERIASLLRWPFALALTHGPALIDRIRGRCDLILHGHRHVPSMTTLDSNGVRPIRIFNAGSSTALRAFRVFEHARGQVTQTRWQFSVCDQPPKELGDLLGSRTFGRVDQRDRRVLHLQDSRSAIRL